jgi:hypothetical protein
MPIPAFLFSPLALKGIAILAVVLGVTVWWNVHNYRVRQAAIAEYKVKLNVCNDQTTVAVNANKSLQSSMQSLMDKLQAQNAAIAKLQTAEAAARKARDGALAAALAQERALQQEISRLTIIANAPAVTQTPEVCREADSVLRAYVRTRGL